MVQRLFDVTLLNFFISVLPSFSGNVPEALKKTFPSANITRLGEWYFSTLAHQYHEF